MMRHRWLGWTGAVLALGLAAPAAAESPLARVPAQAPLVFHLHGFERTRGRLLTLVQKALPGEAARSVQAKLEQALKRLLHGRTLQGVPADGPVFLVFSQLPRPKQEPRAALILRVTSYADFRNGILKKDEGKTLKPHRAGYETATVNGQEVYLAGRQGYAIVTPHKETALHFTRPGPGLDKKLDGETANRFLAADLSLYQDMAALNKEYGATLKEYFSLIEQALRQATHVRKGDQGGEQMVLGMSALLFQAVQDSGAALALAEFQPDGLRLHAQTRIRAETKTSALLKTFQPTPLADLARLPAGQFAYSALRIEPALLQRFPAWLYGAATSTGGKDSSLRAAVRGLAEAGPRSFASAGRLPVQGLQVWRYRDPARAVEASLQLFKAVQAGETFAGACLKGRPQVEANARTHRGLRLHHVRVTWDLDKTVAAQASMEGMPEAVRKQMVDLLKKMMGEGMQTWFGTDGKAVLQITDRDWPSAQRQLDRYLDGKDAAGGQPAFQDVRQRLPARATVLVLVEMNSYARLTAELLQAALPGPAKGPPAARSDAPQPVPAKPSYFGLALTLQPGSGRADAWFPATAVRAYYTALEPLFKLLSAVGSLRERPSDNSPTLEPLFKQLSAAR
jgi:hypothetical protein